jgi:hypothetical protein
VNNLILHGRRSNRMAETWSIKQHFKKDAVVPGESYEHTVNGRVVLWGSARDVKNSVIVTAHPELWQREGNTLMLFDTALREATK